jgi:hypothetical protein
MASIFEVAGTRKLQPVALALKTDDDGDVVLTGNGVELGFFDAQNGKLYLHVLDDEDRERLPGVSLSNGKLTIA